MFFVSLLHKCTCKINTLRLISGFSASVQHLIPPEAHDLEAFNSSSELGGLSLKFPYLDVM